MMAENLPCCGVRGRQCRRLPYDDPWMIASQILAIIAAFFSWIWCVTFVISIAGLVLYQLPWCCRQTEPSLYVSAIAAGAAATCSLGAGIYVLVAFPFAKANECEPFTFEHDNEGGLEGDYCQEEVWATFAFVGSALWAGACGCLVHFVNSGRHAAWEKQHSSGGDAENNNNKEVELEAAGCVTSRPDDKLHNNDVLSDADQSDLQALADTLALQILQALKF